jgi:hypothetical protein
MGPSFPSTNWGLLTYSSIALHESNSRERGQQAMDRAKEPSASQYYLWLLKDASGETRIGNRIPQARKSL